MPLGKRPQHRLKVENGEVVVEQQNRQGFFSGMVSFYGNALSGAKDKLGSIVKNRHKGGEKAHFVNTNYD